MFLNKTHIHEHVPGLICWNVGHEGKKGKAQCNLPGGAGYGSKEGFPRQRTAAARGTVSFSGVPLALPELLRKDKGVVCKRTSKTLANTADHSGKQKQILLGSLSAQPCE